MKSVKTTSNCIIFTN